MTVLLRFAILNTMNAVGVPFVGCAYLMMSTAGDGLYPTTSPGRYMSRRTRRLPDSWTAIPAMADRFPVVSVVYSVPVSGGLTCEPTVGVNVIWIFDCPAPLTTVTVSRPATC